MLRKILSLAFIGVGIALCILFYAAVDLPEDLSAYFKIGFYGQFGHMAIAIELFVAGYHLFRNHPKTNFTMGLFGFTAVLDPIFTYLGIFTSNMSLYGTMIFLGFAIVAFWIAFTNAFGSGKISVLNIILSFSLGVIIELFFNYF